MFPNDVDSPLISQKGKGRFLSRHVLGIPPKAWNCPKNFRRVGNYNLNIEAKM